MKYIYGLLIFIMVLTNPLHPYKTLSEKCLQILNNEYKAIPHQGVKIKNTQKDWTFIVYMAANNNLHKFALHNFRQMLRIGSNNNINIILQIDELGEAEVTRFYVERGNATIFDTLSNNLEAISGTQESLYSFVSWAVKTFPAKHYATLLWNHGSGIKDPSIWGKYSAYKQRDKIFNQNEQTGLFELYKPAKQTHEKAQIKKRKKKKRGIAFNEVHQTYLTNQELVTCLEALCINVLNKRKFDIIMMDACHMGMVEIASEIKHLADYLVGSEEMEPGTGYNYQYLLEPFLQQSFTPKEFAQHTVRAYELEYEQTHGDYTQSAIALEHSAQLEKYMNDFSLLLLQFIQNDFHIPIIEKIRIRMKYTTEFFDSDYIDLKHFLKSVIIHLQGLKERAQKSDDPTRETSLVRMLEQSAFEAITCLDKQVVANCCGVNLPEAGGLAIYFPRRLVHSSYLKTVFSKHTRWSEFLRSYIFKTHQRTRPKTNRNHTTKKKKQQQ